MKRTSLPLLLVLAISTSVVGQDSFLPIGDESDRYESEVFLEGLDNPWGLVSRPAVAPEDPREILFVESGAGRVLKFATGKPKQTQEVLTGLSVQEPTEEITLRVSAWRLGFITPTKLAVLGGTRKNDVEQLSVYLLPTEDKALTAGEIDHAVSLTNGEESNLLFSPGMVVGETAVFLAQGSAEGGGTIFRAEVAANRIEQPRPLLNIKADEDLRWPGGTCLSPSDRTQFLVTGFLGELLGARDGQIAFIMPSNGDVALTLTPGLFDVVDVAYSPSGQLYAVDFARQDESAGGVYRIDDARSANRPSCRAVKIAKVVRPMSLLFDADGALYVTSLGKGDNAKKGRVIKITGEF